MNLVEDQTKKQVQKMTIKEQQICSLAEVVIKESKVEILEKNKNSQRKE